MKAAAGVRQLPTQSELERAVSAFQEDWGAVDDVLYGLCREHPGHDDRRWLAAKVVLISRAYAAGLERCLQPPPGKQAIMVVANHMHAQGAAVDEAVARVCSVCEPLTPADFSEICAAHGALLAVLKGCCNTGKTPRSFAAKYLHFHAPVVPIYDGKTAAALARLVPWREVGEPLAQSGEADEEYWAFCARFLRLYETCCAVGLETSVKTLDAWLWPFPAAG